jgi:hypothetical protein
MARSTISSALLISIIVLAILFIWVSQIYTQIYKKGYTEFFFNQNLPLIMTLSAVLSRFGLFFLGNTIAGTIEK